MVWLQGMPKQMCSRLGLQVISWIGSLFVAPPGLYIGGQVSGNQSTITDNLTLACTASPCTFLVSRGLSTSLPSSGPRRVQAVALWAFCLQGHRVGPLVGVVGSPLRHQACLVFELMMAPPGLLHVFLVCPWVAL